jgi:hypothetical protein
VPYWWGSNQTAGNWFGSNWQNGGEESPGNELRANVSGSGSVSATLTAVVAPEPVVPASPRVMSAYIGRDGGFLVPEWYSHDWKKDWDKQDEAEELAELLAVLDASGF